MIAQRVKAIVSAAVRSQMNNPPTPGRFTHYVSKLAPHVESPAIITGTEQDWVGLLDSSKDLVNNLGESLHDALKDDYSSPRHASLQVLGLVNVYPEWNIPYSGPTDTGDTRLVSGSFKQPGTWHWWDECGEMNDHVHVAPPEPSA